TGRVARAPADSCRCGAWRNAAGRLCGHVQELSCDGGPVSAEGKPSSLIKSIRGAIMRMVFKKLVVGASVIALSAVFGTAASNAVILQTANNGGGNQDYSGVGLEF